MPGVLIALRRHRTPSGVLHPDGASGYKHRAPAEQRKGRLDLQDQNPRPHDPKPKPQNPSPKTRISQEEFPLFRKDLFTFVRFTALLAVEFIASSAANSQTKLLRFPDIRGDRVVFTYGGDLWTASSSGGAATRLTSHPGVELFGKFSPDGKWIAFTGQYDGDEQVYVVPATGGEPRQLTFYPARGPLPPRWGWDNQVFGWSNDGKQIYFRSTRDSWTLTIARLYSVSIDGGPAEALPMPTAGSGDYSPNGAQMVYSPQSRDFRSEKRYGGGQANQSFMS